MKDQKALWNGIHSQAGLRPYSGKQTGFAEYAASVFAPGGRVLELGCGEANDSVYLAEQGFVVEATDFSEVMLERNRARYDRPGLNFSQVDIGRPLPFPDGRFDAVYARLSLHYFTDQVTRSAFAEIARVLKPGGKLCFMCKSVDDVYYGRGIEIEPDMYELEGHVRHYFSEQYARELSADNFIIESLQVSQEGAYARLSGLIKVAAVRR